MRMTLPLLVLLASLLYPTPHLVVRPPSAPVACGKLIIAYDAQKNETQVQLRPLILEGVFQTAPGESLMGENHLPNDDHGVALSALYSYPGKVPSKPQVIVIVIESETTNPRDENDRKLLLKLDAAALDLGIPERAVSRTNMGLTREDLSTEVSYEQFLKIVEAKKVKLSLGPNTFTLTQCHSEALRRLANSIPT